MPDNYFTRLFKKGTLRSLIELFVVILFLFVMMFSLVYSTYNVFLKSDEIFVLNNEVVNLLNQFYNLVITLSMAFMYGILGAYTRMLLAGKVKLRAIIASGLMATFSWVALKSGIAIAIIAPHIEKSKLSNEQLYSDNFYTFILVAVLVGMFSSNLFLFMEAKINIMASSAIEKYKENEEKKD